jgi:hypothetical protein
MVASELVDRFISIVALRGAQELAAFNLTNCVGIGEINLFFITVHYSFLNHFKFCFSHSIASKLLNPLFRTGIIKKYLNKPTQVSSEMKAQEFFWLQFINNLASSCSFEPCVFVLSCLQENLKVANPFSL